jgi:hypothetical protein
VLYPAIHQQLIFVNYSGHFVAKLKELVSPRIVPESPRWLLLHGFYARFRKVLEGAVKMNGLVVSEKVLDQYTSNASNSSPMVRL